MKHTYGRVAGFIAAMTASLALLASAAITTGAYFSDSERGGVARTFGSIEVSTTNLNFEWDKMLPGVWDTASITVTNTGANAQDVYLAFDDTNGQWSDLNTLGTYGEMEINGVNYNNLNNKYPQGTPPNPGQIAIDYVPLINEIKTNLAPDAEYTFDVKFRFADKLKGADLMDVTIPENLEFDIVATQPGVLPTDAKNTTPVTTPTLAPGFYQ